MKSGKIIRNNDIALTASSTFAHEFTAVRYWGTHVSFSKF